VSAARVLERVGGKRTVRPVSFRVSAETRAAGEREAVAVGLTIGQLARQLLLARLRPAAAVSTPGESVSTPSERQIRVVYDE
jgi:hypothetical protein